MNLKEALQKLNQGHIKLKHVADVTGINYQTLHSVVKGVSKNPSYETATAIIKYVEENLR